MKKTAFGVFGVIVIGLLLSYYNVAFGQVTSNLWKLSGSAIIPVISSWTVGNSSTNATFNSLTVSSCSGCGGGSGLATTSLAATYPIQLTTSSANATYSIAFGTTTSNLWAGTQTFTNAPIFSSLSGVLKGNSSSAISVALNGTDFTLISATTCGAGQHISALTAAGGVTCTADTAGGVVGTIATSSADVAGRLLYYTTSSAYPALVSTVATSTLTGTYPVSISNSPAIIGTSGAVVTFPATSTLYGNITSGLLSNTATGVTYGSATSSITCTGFITCTGIAGIGTSNSSITTTGQLAIASGGTNASSFTATNGITAYDGTRLVNFSGYTLTTSLLTASNASTTNLTAGTYFGAPNSSACTGFALGSLCLDTTQNELQMGTSTAVTPAVFSSHLYPSFTYATSTAWTGTTTIPLGTAYVAEIWNGAQCFTNGGTLNVQFGYGSASTTMFNASTTIGTVSFTTNRPIAASTARYVAIGTAASSPTSISCTISKDFQAN